MKKKKLNYRFHDPNVPAVAAEYNMFIEANQKGEYGETDIGK